MDVDAQKGLSAIPDDPPPRRAPIQVDSAAAFSGFMNANDPAFRTLLALFGTERIKVYEDFDVGDLPSKPADD